MAYYPQKTNIQSVISWYEDQERSPFIIFRNNEKFECARYTGIDKSDGIDRLSRYLNEIEMTDYNVYCLKILPGTAKKDQSTPSITFQLYKQSQNLIGNVYQPQHQAMNEILSELRSLRAERMKDLENDSDNEEDEKPETLSEVIAGIIKQPQVINILLGALVGSISRPQRSSNVIAGIDEDLITESIKILLSKGVTAEDFKKLSEMDEAQINFLLGMLRK